MGFERLLETDGLHDINSDERDLACEIATRNEGRAHAAELWPFQ